MFGFLNNNDFVLIDLDNFLLSLNVLILCEYIDINDRLVIFIFIWLYKIEVVS